MTTPKTESGRALLAKEDYAMPEDILAIEQEAASAAVAGLREAAERLVEVEDRPRPEVPGPTTQEVELYWATWDRDRMDALDALRAALIAESREEGT